ncbi:DeoR/GlpR family DNA-binding transcription regulator [Actinokineospora sp. PR83]|uniref:DeoR/GlpR family DNA-binding transcription regulator n=1 Tax=Actinokineospora sp. PR83 TaxID=2884908 RepID=UPI0027DEBE97|nr:DeoR/GlpR family DNA-binding transcription regulator [Actinokineospora sp. PR83]
MRGDERRRVIVARLRQGQRVEVAAVAAETGASEMTVRRDLDALAATGVLRRVHGGAVAATPGSVEQPFATRATAGAEAKRRIAAAVAAMVRDAEVVVLDSGTTAVQVAKALRGRPVTVMPLSLHAARELLDDPQARVLMCGGEPRRGEWALTGPLAVASLRAVRFDVAVISPCGFDTATGLTAVDLDDAQVKQEAMAAAGRVLAAVDGGKWGHTAMARICPADRVDVLVTDDTAPAADRAELAGMGVTIHVC